MAFDGKMPKICIIGAGFSGMCSAIQLEKQIGFQNYTIFDENDDFGGTWLKNKYPGCACDVQSHFYSFSFELNPDWSKAYSSQPEIWKYISKIADKYKLHQKAKFNKQIKRTEWIEKEGKWEVTVYDKISKKEEIIKFDFIINGCGILRVPNFPVEFDGFTGPKIHSAVWNNEINLKDKKVGIIGSGASTIQIVPSIAPIVKELHCYQRKPAWVAPVMQFNIPGFMKKLFAFFPFLMTILRFFLFLGNEMMHPILKAGSFANSIASSLMNLYLKTKIKDEKLREELRPNYKLACKRITISNDYYDTFALPHVYLRKDPIVKAKGNLIKTADGHSQQLDVLILATGYKPQDYFAPLVIIGKDQKNILSEWKANGPNTYYGIMSSDIPNAFFLLGPNTALGHNSVVYMIECQVDFIIQVVKECLSRGAKSASIKKSIEKDWMAEHENNMKKTIWGTESCGSWYADEKGRITQLWTKNCYSYYKETCNVNFNNFDFTYED